MHDCLYLDLVNLYIIKNNPILNKLDCIKGWELSELGLHQLTTSFVLFQLFLQFCVWNRPLWFFFHVCEIFTYVILIVCLFIFVALRGRRFFLLFHVTWFYRQILEIRRLKFFIAYTNFRIFFTFVQRCY